MFQISFPGQSDKPALSWVPEHPFQLEPWLPSPSMRPLASSFRSLWFCSCCSLHLECLPAALPYSSPLPSHRPNYISGAATNLLPSESHLCPIPPCKLPLSSPVIFYFSFLFFSFLNLSMGDTEREAQTQAEGEEASLWGAQ